MTATERQEILVKPKRGRVCRLMQFVPPQLRAPECLSILWIRDCLQQFRVAEGGEITKLMSSSGSNEAAELILVIGEKLKRCRSCPLLAHEKHGRVRHDAKQRGGRAVSRRLDDVAEPLAERAV